MNPIIKDKQIPSIKNIPWVKNAVQQTVQALHKQEKLKAWFWFILLWLSGLLGTLILVYGTKSVFWMGRMLLSNLSNFYLYILDFSHYPHFFLV